MYGTTRGDTEDLENKERREKEGLWGILSYVGDATR